MQKRVLLVVSFRVEALVEGIHLRKYPKSGTPALSSDMKSYEKYPLLHISANTLGNERASAEKQQG